MEIIIYTDGSSRGNPGPGGYGAILMSGGKTKELSQGYRRTTNNRMELMAVIEALKKLKNPGTAALVFTDSKYVVDAVEKKWVLGWEKKAFKDRKNADLWKEFLKEYRKHHIKFQWIKGHNNHIQNERCDMLAVEASRQPNLPPDAGFFEEST